MVVGCTGNSFQMRNVSSSLPSVARSNRDPPTQVGRVKPVPDGPTSSFLAGPRPDVPASSQAGRNKKEPEQKGSPTIANVDAIIQEGEGDVEEWKTLGLLDDDDMLDAKDSKKRDRGYAEEAGVAESTDQGEVLAPFPLVSHPALFVRDNLGATDFQEISQVAPNLHQEWLMTYLKNALLNLPQDLQEMVLAAPREQRFMVMKNLYQQRRGQEQGQIADPEQQSSS